MAIYLESWEKTPHGLTVDYHAVSIRIDRPEGVPRDELALLVQAAGDEATVSVSNQEQHVSISRAPEWCRDERGLPLAWNELIERCRWRLQKVEGGRDA